MKHMSQAYTWVESSTLIKTGWLCAHYAHGQEVPAWLHQALSHVQQQTDKSCLSAVVLPACGREDSLVVITLGDFLFWSHHRAVFNVSVVKSRPDAYSSKEE